MIKTLVKCTQCLKNGIRKSWINWHLLECTVEREQFSQGWIIPRRLLNTADTSEDQKVHRPKYDLLSITTKMKKLIQIV